MTADFAPSHRDDSPTDPKTTKPASTRALDRYGVHPAKGASRGVVSRTTLAVIAVMASAAACTVEPAEEQTSVGAVGGVGGTVAPGTGGIMGTGATPGSGGVGSGAMGVGGGTGGGGVPGAGGTATGGTGGTVGVGPQPSAGCGTANPTVGARTITVQGDTGNFIVSIPSTYDASSPYPLGFGFHGYGRTHENCQQGDCAGFQSVMGEEAILVYMKSFTEGWEQEPVRDKNAEFFENVLDLMEAEFCVDERRVFVAGTSSGASFTNVLGCRYGDRLLAVAPVAGSLPENQNCVGQVAAVPIHGIDDPHVTFESGETARDFYLAQNGCTMETVPNLADVHAEIRASRDAAQTNQKCVDYQGCAAGFPVRWCEHSEGGYDNSTHGWPTAGGQMIWDFVKEL